MGIDSFKGIFTISNHDEEDLQAQVDNINDSIKFGGNWNTPDATFDSTLVATRSLFEIRRTEGCIDVMSAGIIGRAPVFNFDQLTTILLFPSSISSFS